MAEETKTTAKARKRRKALSELTSDELEQLRAKEAQQFALDLRQVSGAHPVPSKYRSSTRNTATDSAPLELERRLTKRERRAARKGKAT